MSRKDWGILVVFSIIVTLFVAYTFLWLGLIYFIGYLYNLIGFENVDVLQFNTLVVISTLPFCVFILFKWRSNNLKVLIGQGALISLFSFPMFTALQNIIGIGIDQNTDWINPFYITIVLTISMINVNTWYSSRK
jgi:hypothetical protein